MSDQKLRELERRWRETGSLEDEATWLRERVRVGDLTPARLSLAAYCGHEGARSAAHVHPQAPTAQRVMNDRELLTSAEEPGLPVAAAIAVVEACVVLMSEEHLRSRVAEALAASKAALASSSADTSQSAELVANRAGAVPWAYDCGKAAAAFAAGQHAGALDWSHLALVNAAEEVGEARMLQVLCEFALKRDEKSARPIECPDGR